MIVQISAADTIRARQELGLSQAAVAKATGIPRNIMSAFEQQKIVMLDEMQFELRAYLESQGFEFDRAANDEQYDSTDQSEIANGIGASDAQIRDGFCIPSGLDIEDVDLLLIKIHDIESEIDAILPAEVKDVGFFGHYPDRKSRLLHGKLLLLHARWACLVRRIQGREFATYPCDPNLLDSPPSSQSEMLSQRLTKGSPVFVEDV